jgi:hypothetical protein
MTPAIIIGSYPYSNLTCISSWYIMYTKYHLNPSNHHWGNERKLSLSRVWWTDGRRTGRTSPYHKTSRFQRAYKIEVRILGHWGRIEELFNGFVLHVNGIQRNSLLC